jgi:hypothetical protein
VWDRALTTGKWLGRTPATAIPAKRNSVVISIAQKLQNVGMALARIARFCDFQAEYMGSAPPLALAQPAQKSGHPVLDSEWTIPSWFRRLPRIAI